MKGEHKHLFFKALCYGVAAFAIDQVTKLWALRTCLLQPVELPPLHLQVFFNSGISLSLLEDKPLWVIFLVAGACLFLSLRIRERLKCGRPVIPHAVILGSAFSNIYDRFFYSGVVDFITIKAGMFEFPTWNFADIFIIMAVFYLVVFNES